jgi:polyhydroxyalkanoate synthase
VAALEARLAELEARSTAPEAVAELLKESPRSRRARQRPLRAGASSRDRPRLDRLAEGVIAYRRHPSIARSRRRRPPGRKGNTRLLDYGHSHRAARQARRACRAVIPSLINRWEVLDLTAEKSLMRALAAAGLRPYLVDWARPTPRNGASISPPTWRGWSARVAFVGKRARRSPAVMGYCMGGTLAVAPGGAPAAQGGEARAARSTLGLPRRQGGPGLPAVDGPAARAAGRQLGELPVDVLQTLFWSVDPWLAMKKFRRFLGMDPQAIPARDFVLLEDWLNEGAPLAGPTARDCLLGWYGDNLPGTGKWTSAASASCRARSRSPRW